MGKSNVGSSNGSENSVVIEFTKNAEYLKYTNDESDIMMPKARTSFFFRELFVFAITNPQPKFTAVEKSIASIQTGSPHA